MTTHLRHHHHRSTAHLVVALLLAVGLLTALPTAADAASGRLTVRSAIAGERTTATGVVPVRSSKPRTVVLQRKSGSRWVSVVKARTSRKGAFTLKHTQRASSTSYRVLAPRSGKARRTATVSRTSRPIPQSGRMSAPVGARPGTTFEVSVRFSPARTGRPVVVQRRVGSSWQTVETGVQSPKGTFTGVVGAPSERGPAQLRAVTAARGGAKATTTAVVAVEVDQSEVVSRDDQGQAMASNALFNAADRTGRHVLFGGTADQLAGGTEARFMLALRDTVAGRTVPVTVTPEGRPLDANTFSGDLSSDGRTVVFSTVASTVLPGDGNGRSDVFAWDRDTRRTQLLTGDAQGRFGPGGSDRPVISPNGRFVAFSTFDPDLLGGASTLREQVVRLDRETGTIVHASVTPDGAPGLRSAVPLAVGDQGSVLFSTDARLDARDDDDTPDAYLLDPAATRPRLVGSQPDLSLSAADLSGDGSTVVTISGSRVATVVQGGRARTLAQRMGSNRAHLSDDGSVLVVRRPVGDGPSPAEAVVAIELRSGRQTVLSSQYPGAAPAFGEAAGISGDGRIGYYVANREDATNLPGHAFQAVARRIVL